MKMIPWLIGAILGYLIGGVLLAIPILVAGIVVVLAQDILKSMKQPAFIGAMAIFFLNLGILWVINWLFGFTAESLPWWLGLIVMFGPSLVAGIVIEIKYGNQEEQ